MIAAHKFGNGALTARECSAVVAVHACQAGQYLKKHAGLASRYGREQTQTFRRVPLLDDAMLTLSGMLRRLLARGFGRERDCLKVNHARSRGPHPEQIEFGFC